jgi:hypothetical protein
MPVPIYTFRFSYNLQNGLLQLIAEFNGGNYCFIPNASMLSTIFKYAIANLKTVYIYNTIIILSYLNSLDFMEFRLYIGKAAPKKVIKKREGVYIEYSINLKMIWFG